MKNVFIYLENIDNCYMYSMFECRPLNIKILEFNKYFNLINFYDKNSSLYKFFYFKSNYYYLKYYLNLFDLNLKI